MAKKDQKYTAESIQIFEGVKAVQKRPGMYLGSTDQDGFHHLIWEIIDNSLDEYLAGFCDTIKVTAKKDNVILIGDNGRGIPPGIHSKTGVSTIETVFTSLHAGGKFDSQTYQVSGGLHGVGSTVVNAMSDYLKVDVFREGKTHTLEFRGGITTDEGLVVIENNETKKTGTTVEFKPNLKLFDDSYSFNAERIMKRLQETAFINDGVRIIFFDERDGTEKTFYHKNGIRDFLDFLTGDELIRDQQETPVYAKNTALDITCRFTFRYTNSTSLNIYSFCNNIKTHEGGSHERGFKKAITWTTRKIMKQFKAFAGKDEELKPEDCLSGLVSIISILHPDPKFAGQTKTKLTNNDVSSVVYQIAARGYEKFLLENPRDRKLIFNKVLRSHNLRIEIEKKIKEIKEKDKIFENSTLPGKLADCASKVKEDRELFLVEGDSAGGSAKLGRNREFQAILPLKGKIINSEKTTQDRLFANEEISDLISSLGFTYKSIQNLNSEEEEEEGSKKLSISDILRYHKIIIMTDADVDGSHIAVLLLTFFYRFFPQLINNGHVFLAQPPLYKLKIGKKVSYIYSEEKLREATKDLEGRFELQRYKGLGEMNPGQLWETTMNPEYRSLRKIHIDQVASSDKIIEILMGKEVDGRKKFISENSSLVNEEELDI